MWCTFFNPQINLLAACVFKIVFLLFPFRTFCLGALLFFLGITSSNPAIFANAPSGPLPSSTNERRESMSNAHEVRFELRLARMLRRFALALAAGWSRLQPLSRGHREECMPSRHLRPAIVQPPAMASGMTNTPECKM